MPLPQHRCITVFLTVLLLSFSPVDYAHHSALANFDSSNVITREGTLLEVKVLNPHCSMRILVTDEEGNSEEWLVEMLSKNALVRQNFDFSRFIPGKSVKITGWAGRRRNTMYFVKAEFPDGTVIDPPDRFGQPLL